MKPPNHSKNALVFSLAACPGWNQWALPTLRAKIQGIETQLLTKASSLSGKQTRALGAKRDVLREFLAVLHADARAALPETRQPTTEEEPDDTVAVQSRLKSAFTLPDVIYATARTVSPAEKPPPIPSPTFDPFAGPIQSGQDKSEKP